MENSFPLNTHKTDSISLYFIGPDFSQKAKTALYFSLSGEESLTALPFAKPAHLLAEKGYRVISATLPGHENNERPQNLRELWGKMPESLETFFFNMESAISEIEPMVDGKLAALGLSRGGFVATHLAARIDLIDSVVGYAPLTRLENASHLDLIHLADQVKSKKIRYSIGHNDTRVSTQSAIETINTFIDKLSAKGLQQSTMQLIIAPSIGRDGHGTSEKIFSSGIEWVVNERES